MTIRPATVHDLAAISAIQKLAPDASAWAPLDYTCYAADDAEHVAGFLVVRTTVPGESEILNLAVDPAYRRRGIAKLLLQRALAEAPGAWFLEVRESNQAAISLYLSLGFTPSGRRENYYADPAEAAIVMSFFS